MCAYSYNKYVITYNVCIKCNVCMWYIVGPKQQKKLRKLVMNRIKWSEDSVNAKDSGEQLT